jgi:hypothetical protein
MLQFQFLNLDHCNFANQHMAISSISEAPATLGRLGIASQPYLGQMAVPDTSLHALTSELRPFSS